MDAMRIAQQTVEMAQQRGASQSEAYILHAKALTIEIADGEVETLKLAEDCGIGLRVITTNGQMGFAFSSDLNKKPIQQTIRQAMDNAEKTSADPYNSLPQRLHKITGLRTFDPALEQISLAEKISLAQKLEDSARRFDSRIKGTERALYEDGIYGVTIVNSHGVAVQYHTGYCGIYAAVLAEAEGDIQSGSGLQYSIDYNRLNPVATGQESAEDAVRLLGAKSMASQKTTLILSPYIATAFLDVLAPALTADAVQKGKSLFGGKIGADVASPLISLVDDGCMEGGIATAPADSEGVPTNKTILIKEGKLQGFLHNTYTASQANVSSTGNGTRNTFKAAPGVGPTNLFIQPGTVDEHDVMREVKHGLYVTSVMGMHTANPISGDFSVGAAGILIENGRMKHAVRGVAIAGNIVELLNNVDAVANNLRFFGPTGAPALRMQGVSVSGS